MLRNTSTNWGSLSRWFHWILGIVIIGMIAYGWWMNHFPARADRFFYRSDPCRYRLRRAAAHRDPADLARHQPDTGAARRHPAMAADRLTRQPLGALSRHHPGGDAGLGAFRRTSANQNYASFFGLFNVPQFTSPDKVAAGAYEDRHIFFAYVLLALIVLHVAAAAWHHFIRRDRVAMRMVSSASAGASLEFLQKFRVVLPLSDDASGGVWLRSASPIERAIHVLHASAFRTFPLSRLSHLQRRTSRMRKAASRSR